MSFGDAVKSVLTLNYANFNGRAGRAEFWYYVLFAVIASVVLGLIDRTTFVPMVGFSLLSAIFTLATLSPAVAVSFRRLHDTDRSGWWAVIGFVLSFLAAVLMQLFGIIAALVLLAYMIVLIVWYASRGTEGDNRFGPPPAV